MSLQTSFIMHIGHEAYTALDGEATGGNVLARLHRSNPVARMM
jgi:hypothetical protein